MDIGQLKTGNIIVVYPRANQEGILSVREMQQGSIICDMLSPRPGYQFRIRFNEVNPVPLSSEWLTKASFRKASPETGQWIAPDDDLPFLFTGDCGVFSNDLDRQVSYVHQLQNTYRELTGKELHIA